MPAKKSAAAQALGEAIRSARRGLGVALVSTGSRGQNGRSWGMESVVRYGTMPDRSRKRPQDANQRAKLIVDIAVGEVDDVPTDDGKDPAAVALGRKGGLKGGKARAAKMTPEQRTEAARLAARSRWGVRER